MKKEILPLQFKGEVINKEIKKDEIAIITIKNKNGNNEKYTFNLKLIDDTNFFKKLQKGNWAIKEKGEQSFKRAVINTSQSAEIFTYQFKCK